MKNKTDKYEKLLDEIFNNNYKPNFFDKIYNISKKIWYWTSKRWYCYIINRPYIIKIKLDKPREWIDKDHLILLSCMTLLEKYVEEEKPFDIINWDFDHKQKEAKEEIQTIYNWWKNYNNQVKEIADTIKEWSESKKNNHNLNNDLFNKITVLEEKLENQEQDMLIRLIKIRKQLWT